MLLNAEVKDDAYADMPRQQDVQYAQASSTYLRADAATGKHYVDLNAAAKTYMGAWLFGQEHVQVNVGRLRAQWLQWCPVPAGIADGVLLRGNVIYQNPDKTYRTSADQFEGVLRTEGRERVFVGKTQHTFYASNLPNGQMKVVADINIPLTERLAYNPMISLPSQQIAQRQNIYQQMGGQPAYGNGYGNGGANGYGGPAQGSPQGYAAPAGATGYGAPGYATASQAAAPYANYNASYNGTSQEPDSGF